MSDANVLSALDNQKNDSYKRPSLTNIIIYGRVRCIIKKPSIIGDGIKETNGHFAIIDAYALKCLGEDYFRDGSTYDVNGVYFTKGSILLYINDPSWVGKDVKVFGKSKSYGATIRRQDNSKSDSGISAFMFGPPEKVGMRSVYPLVPNVLVPLQSKDNDTRGTALEDFIVTIASKGEKIPYPETLNSIIPYTGVTDYLEVPVEDIQNQNNTNSFKTNIKSNNTKSFIDNGKRVDISKIDMGLTFHLKGQEQSEYFDSFKEDISANALSREDFVKDTIESIDSMYKEFGLKDYRAIKEAFIVRVADTPSRSLGNYSSVRCKHYIDTFVDGCCDVLESEDNLYADVSQREVKVGIDKLKNLVMADSSVLYGGTDDADIDNLPILKDDISFVANVIGTCTGIGYSVLSSNFSYCNRRLNISPILWLFMLLRCPYALGMLGVGLTVVDCDILYFSFGSVYDEGEMSEFNMMYRSYLLMLDTLSSCTKGKYKRNSRGSRGINTFVKTSDYKAADCCYPDRAIKNISTFDFPGNPDVKDLLEILLGVDVYIPDEYEKSITGKWYSDNLFNSLCEIGVVNTLDDYCALERDIEREFLIYEVFEKMGKTSTGINDATIRGVISSFEESRGFKLEDLQKEGIKLCKFRAGVLSGCAGSGKTTTSDCMTEALKTLGDDVKIVYCTPTGKACRRLAEVVHSTVKTIHSQFGVGLGGSSYLQNAYRVNNKKKDDDDMGTIYILDEMAMCSTELMYHIARNISENDMIYFLGDIKQLPPIGGGCPFKILMTVLPCVELGVSKRAAEGSLINYNTSLINFMSDNYCMELLYDDKTFIERECPDANIAGVVRSMFSGFIDGSANGTSYQEDDIQVITGYQTAERLSSTARLNRPIQEYLRKNDRVLYYRESRENGGENLPFYQNDRVIYINRNSYDICRYVYQGGVFHQVATFGCVNGEVGKLLGVIRSTDIIINGLDSTEITAGEGFYSNVSEDELATLLERFEQREEDLRSDSTFSHEDFYFIVVKVYDSDLKRDVVALLRGKGRYVDGDFCLAGSDLSNLSLAYALTCHKMQGSQSPVVIAAFESKGSPDFLNRNMINTIITRSQEVVCCVGSVKGSESMINRGRLKVSNCDSRDILSIMSGTARWIDV